MEEKNSSQIFLPLIISIALHLIIFNISPFLSDILRLKDLPSKNLTEPIQIEQISMDELQKLRTVGVKGGKKEFSDKIKTTVIRKPKLKDLKVTSSKAIKQQAPKAQKKKSSISTISYKKNDEPVAPTSSSYDPGMEKNLIKDLAVTGDSASALKVADFNVSFEPPEGISEDELNSLEKIFYSFQKRTFKSYVTSFIQTYNNAVLAKPYIKSPLMSQKHTMTGKITFDREGNIVSIRILRWSADDNVQELFQNTLEGIQALPNPPKALIQNKEQFSIFYQLNINP